MAQDIIQNEDEDWKRLTTYESIPLNLSDIEPLQALGYVNQFLTNLIYIHEHANINSNSSNNNNGSSIGSLLKKFDLDRSLATIPGDDEDEQDEHEQGHGPERTNGHGRDVSSSPSTAVVSPMITQSPQALSPLDLPHYFSNANTNNSGDQPQERDHIISPLAISRSTSPREGGSDDSVDGIIPTMLSRSRRRSSILSSEASTVAAIVKKGNELMTNELMGNNYNDTASVNTNTMSDLALQKLSISRRFLSKVPPPISTWKYLQRLHNYCPSSTAVYLTAAVYIYRLCIIFQTIPVSSISVHRLILACFRVASKSLEDINHDQKRFASIGGISAVDLYRLEIALLFTLDFNLKIDEFVLSKVLGYFVDLDEKASRFVD